MGTYEEGEVGQTAGVRRVHERERRPQSEEHRSILRGEAVLQGHIGRGGCGMRV